MSKLVFLSCYTLTLFTLVLTLTTLLPTLVLAQDKELSAEAKADDANEDGLLQKNEAKYPATWVWKANFDQIDCDKNSGLDGAEIKRFTNYKACPNQGAGAHIYHRRAYPTGSGPFPAVIALHTSGGAKGTRILIENYRQGTWLKAGYAWYAPNFFERHGITNASRFDTWDIYREDIEKELSAIITLMKTDPKIDSKNIFGVGFSNGGFWSSFLAGKGIVTAAASHYGIWLARNLDNEYPEKYFSSTSSPFLALHGEDDSTQKIDYYLAAHSIIKDTPNFEDHIYKGAGHAWDCFPYFPKWFLERRPKRAPRILERLKGVCANFDGSNREVTNDALKRTIDFFKKHAKS
jgi:dienelactone hydrolase